MLLAGMYEAQSTGLCRSVQESWTAATVRNAGGVALTVRDTRWEGDPMSLGLRGSTKRHHPR